MSGLTACLFTSLMFVRAPVPPEKPPDPLARGYVGITVQTGALAIERVEPGLPAFKAGVRPGDVIVRVGTLEPHNFEQVVAHICSFRPGGADRTGSAARLRAQEVQGEAGRAATGAGSQRRHTRPTDHH